MKTLSQQTPISMALVSVLLSATLCISCDTEDEQTTQADAMSDDRPDANLSADAGTPSDTDAAIELDAAPEPINDRQATLRSIAANVYRPTYSAFLEAAQSMASATVAWSEVPGPGSSEAARAAWLELNQIWQRAELMQVGPAGIAGRRIGGADLRDKIYSYPAINACRVDQVIHSQAYAEDGWADSALFNVQGLDALEYLLYNESVDNQCPAAVSLNRTGLWAPLAADPDALWARRAAMAKVLADQLVVHATTLSDTWADGSEFSESFINGGERFGSFKTALDQVFAGMFYVDKFIKDLKLGKPAGITPDCEADVCITALESKFARVSKENLLANLEGFRQIYLGGADDSGYGFDDLLRSEGADELADTLENKIGAAVATLEAIDGTLAGALTADPASVRAVHEAVKSITDDLKTQFVTVLNLSVPQEGAGDND